MTKDPQDDVDEISIEIYPDESCELQAECMGKDQALLNNDVNHGRLFYVVPPRRGHDFALLEVRHVVDSIIHNHNLLREELVVSCISYVNLT